MYQHLLKPLSNQELRESTRRIKEQAKELCKLILKNRKEASQVN